MRIVSKGKAYLIEITKHEVDDDIFRKVIIVHAVSIICVFTLFTLGSVSFLQENFLLGLLDIILSFIVASTLLFFRKTGNYQLSCYFGIIIVGIFFMYLFFTGEGNNTTFVWYYTFPLGAFYLLGSKKGAFATLMIFVPALLFLLLDHQIPFFTKYHFDFKVRFIPSFLVVFAFAYIYEKLREEQHGKLKKTNEILDQKVVARTFDLRMANEKMLNEIKDRKGAERRLEKAHKCLLTILNNLNAIVYMADMETYEVFWLNKYAQTVFGDGVGKKCWHVFQKNQTGPCEFCSNHELIDVNGVFKSYSWEMENTLNGRWYDMRDCAANWIDDNIVRVQIATDITNRKKADQEKNRLISELQDALSEIKKLEGIIPICSYCKKIRDDEGYWNQLEKFITEHSEAQFSHSICNECMKKHYPEFSDQ